MLPIDAGEVEKNESRKVDFSFAMKREKFFGTILTKLLIA
jgi:hypothetical protein